MRRYHPHHFADIPVSVHVNYQLHMASLRTGEQKQDWEIAEEAIDEWTRRHNPDALAIPLTKGYQWKHLFLPEGTVLRTVFRGKNYHCVVEGDHILYNQQAVSPSGFVNAVGGIRRNAWRCTWILLPEAKDWKLADTLRSRASPRRTRSPEAPPAPAQVPASGAPVAFSTVDQSCPPAPIQGVLASDAAGHPVQQASIGQGSRNTGCRERRKGPQAASVISSPPGVNCGTNRGIEDAAYLGAWLRGALTPHCACAQSGRTG